MLALVIGETFEYFIHGILSFIVALFLLKDYLLDFFNTGGFYNPSVVEIVGFVLLALAVILILYRRQTLKFLEIKTLLPHNEQLKLFRELSEAYGIEPAILRKDVLVLEFRPELPASGQRVTLVFENGMVLFNSITRPEDIGGRRSIRFGENKTNFEIFREELEDREREYLAIIKKAGA